MRTFSQDEKLTFTPAAAEKDALRCIYAYPNEYSVGICSLGYQLVWSWLSVRTDVHVARLFTDASEPIMRNPDLIGFCFSWELDYAHILAMLEEQGLSLRSEQRADWEPIVFGGGPVLTANPEPYADFFDVVLLGDGEDLLDAFIQAFQSVRGSSGSRRDRLTALTQVPGVYVPALYEVEYQSLDGPISSISPISDTVPAWVTKQTYRGNKLAVSSVVTQRMAWENIFMVEVVRSCPEMCRFCLASYVTLPFRSASVQDSLLPSIEEGMQLTDRIGLLGASVTQHPHFDELLDFMLRPALEHIRLSIASVRTNTVTEKLAAALAKRGTKSLTVAVESGSDRMRSIVNKKLSSEEIREAVVQAQAGGLEGFKLYGMVGLPGEHMEDVEETVAMMQRLQEAAPHLKLTLGCSTFAHTPFQWYGLSKDGESRLEYLDKEMRRLSVDFRPESYKWSIIQALLSRGDRRLGRLLEQVRLFGDSKGSFRRAFKELRGQLPPLEYYVHRQCAIGEEILPWSHLHGPLPETTLVGTNVAAHSGRTGSRNTYQCGRRAWHSVAS
eukprot:SM000402S15223  [mRNA]  locus=s402:4965:9120:+ [translate_table: standard]